MPTKETQDFWNNMGETEVGFRYTEGSDSYSTILKGNGMSVRVALLFLMDKIATAEHISMDEVMFSLKATMMTMHKKAGGQASIEAQDTAEIPVTQSPFVEPPPMTEAPEVPDIEKLNIGIPFKKG